MLMVSSPLFQLHGHNSSVCRASSTLRTSSGLRPTFKSVTQTNLMIPSGSIINVARFETDSSSFKMPNLFDSFSPISDIIGKGSSFNWLSVFFQARCTNSLSVLAPSRTASLSEKS